MISIIFQNAFYFLDEKYMEMLFALCLMRYTRKLSGSADKKTLSCFPPFKNTN